MKNDKLTDVFRSVAGEGRGLIVESAAAGDGGGWWVGASLTAVLLGVAAACLYVALQHYLRLRDAGHHRRRQFERRVWRALEVDRPTRRLLRGSAKQMNVTNMPAVLAVPSLLRTARRKASKDKRPLLDAVG